METIYKIALVVVLLVVIFNLGQALFFMMKDKDEARAKRVSEAMLGMKKLDIADLKQAYEGNLVAR